MRIAACVAFAVVGAALAACGEEPPPAAKPAPAMSKGPQISYQVLKPAEMTLPSKYPIKTCAACGKELPPTREARYGISYKGYELQLCSEKCSAEFERDPEGCVLKMNPRAIFTPK
jgi:YHS domain-containing protein